MGLGKEASAGQIPGQHDLRVGPSGQYAILVDCHGSTGSTAPNMPADLMHLFEEICFTY